MATANQQFQFKKLREERGKIKAELEKLGDKIRTEQRAMSSEEQAQFETLKTSFAGVSEQIRKAESDLAALDSLLAADSGDMGGESDPAADGGENSKRVPGKNNRNTKPQRRGHDAGGGNRTLLFDAWARRQAGMPLREEHVKACKQAKFNPRSKEFRINLGDPRTRRERLSRALTVTTTGGGYTIAQDFSNELERTLVDYSNVRGVCDEFQTDTGADLPWPREDDTSNSGELLGINADAAFSDPSFASVTFGAYKFSSKGILIPNELLQDSAFDMAAYLSEQIGTRIGRSQGSYFTTGTGSSQPQGIVTASTLGVTSASATAIAPAEVVRLAHAVDPSYRTGPKVGYMMHDSTLAYLMTLYVDSSTDKRRLITESWQDPSSGPQVRLNGFPVYVNQFMAQSSGSGGIPVTASKHILFGDFAKFKVRDAGMIRVRRLDERYAEKDQVGFIAFLRSDSKCVNTNAIKHLLQA